MPYLFVNKFDEEDRDDPFSTARTQGLRGHRKKFNKGTWVTWKSSFTHKIVDTWKSLWEEVAEVSNVHQMRERLDNIDMETRVLEFSLGPRRLQIGKYMSFSYWNVNITWRDPFVSIWNLECRSPGETFHWMLGGGEPSAMQSKTTMPPTSTTEKWWNISVWLQEKTFILFRMKDVEHINCLKNFFFLKQKLTSVFGCFLLAAVHRESQWLAHFKFVLPWPALHAMETQLLITTLLFILTILHLHIIKLQWWKTIRNLKH